MLISDYIRRRTVPHLPRLGVPSVYPVRGRQFRWLHNDNTNQSFRYSACPSAGEFFLPKFSSFNLKICLVYLVVKPLLQF